VTKQTYEIETTEGRRKAWRHFQWVDHAVLRYRWTNFDQVAEGLYRSNHPNHARLEEFAAMGGKTVLSLRGGPNLPPHLFEAEICEKLGLNLVAIGLSARKAPRQDRLIELLEAFETLERPILMHCKSGADRTGLASVLYLMIHEGKSIADVKDQLSFKYLHIRKSATGILDHFLAMYAEHNAQSPTSVESYIRNHYDPAALSESFDAYQKSLKIWEGWR